MSLPPPQWVKATKVGGLEQPELTRFPWSRSQFHESHDGMRKTYMSLPRYRHQETLK
jgi:hypothetical protein